MSKSEQAMNKLFSSSSKPLTTFLETVSTNQGKLSLPICYIFTISNKASRVKDWLYGITPNHTGGDKTTVVNGAFEAEDILSVYHIVNWSKDLGGAGITPGTGKWENVKAIFPLHNTKVNQSLLSHLSRRFFLAAEDIDKIRDLHGSKV